MSASRRGAIKCSGRWYTRDTHEMADGFFVPLFHSPSISWLVFSLEYHHLSKLHSSTFSLVELSGIVEHVIRWRKKLYWFENDAACNALLLMVLCYSKNSQRQSYLTRKLSQSYMSTYNATSIPNGNARYLSQVNLLSPVYMHKKKTNWLVWSHHKFKTGTN